MQESIFTSLVMLFTDNCGSRGAALFLNKRKSIFSRPLALRDIHYACYLKPQVCGTDVYPSRDVDRETSEPWTPGALKQVLLQDSVTQQLFWVQNSVKVCLKSNPEIRAGKINRCIANREMILNRF